MRALVGPIAAHVHHTAEGTRPSRAHDATGTGTRDDTRDDQTRPPGGHIGWSPGPEWSRMAPPPSLCMTVVRLSLRQVPIQRPLSLRTSLPT